jgi:tRNA pseudouridine38-40 synthase
MRVRLIVAYHGARYHGWQIQDDVPTVEGAVTDAVEAMTGARRKVWGASRTDAGVHAEGQVAAFDHDSPRDVRALFRGLNHHTPDDIAIRAVDVVPDAFHPRHDARGKIYHYDLWCRWERTPFFADRTLHVRRALNVEAMARAGALLVGQHDFSAFRGAGCDARSPVRRLWEVSVLPLGDGRVRIRVAGSAFLKYMVRNIVGTLVMIGTGTQRPEWILDVLESRDRGMAGPTAKPQGLTLVRVFHPRNPVRS